MTRIAVEAVEIDPGPGLDRLHVFWHDAEPGKGSVTITCFGCAWTAYWGAMSNRSIRQFFQEADTGYLVTKLGITPLLKQRNADHAYLARIVDAIKAELAKARGESE